jgi:hypothetical protein
MSIFNPSFHVWRANQYACRAVNRGWNLKLKFDAELGCLAIIPLKYGYSYGFGNLCHEGADSPLRGQTYRIFHQNLPKEGDIWMHLKSQRIFKVTEIEGFLQYNAKLIDVATGKQVAVITFEDYYKD